jgi:hypothetical protein
MMFIKTNQDVEKGEELTVHYLFVEKSGEKQRNETLENAWGFTCQCELCIYERENEETCQSADKIVDKAVFFAKTATSDDAIKKLLSARKKLYDLYQTPIPDIEISSALDSPPPTPPAALVRSLVLVLRELMLLIRDGSCDESLIGTVNGGYHFLLKEFSHFDRVGTIGEAALRVWEYLHVNSTDSDLATDWLTEARETHDRLLGEGHFEYQFGKFVQAVQ